MKEVERAKEILGDIMQDKRVPKNIKDTCNKAVERLLDRDQEAHIRISAAISLLDEVSEDPNLPFHTRTRIWEAASLLETAVGKVK